jgi:hypothetical protein
MAKQSVSTAAAVLNSARTDESKMMEAARSARLPQQSHVAGEPIGTRRTVKIVSASGREYNRYACMCQECRKARSPITSVSTHSLSSRPRSKAIQGGDVAGAARKMNAARKVHGAGDGRPRSVEHVRGLPIGSRKTDSSRGYPAYVCNCLDCRIARGHHKPAAGYVKPGRKRK